MSTIIGMGANKSSRKNNNKEIETLKTRVTELESELATEKSAKEVAETKVAELEKELSELNKENK